MFPLIDCLVFRFPLHYINLNSAPELRLYFFQLVRGTCRNYVLLGSPGGTQHCSFPLLRCFQINQNTIFSTGTWTALFVWRHFMTSPVKLFHFWIASFHVTLFPLPKSCSKLCAQKGLSRLSLTADKAGTTNGQPQAHYPSTSPSETWPNKDERKPPCKMTENGRGL